LKKKSIAGLGLALMALAIVFALFSFWRENWAANQAPGPVERFLAGLLLSGSRDVEDRPNPFSATEENLSEGRQLYESQCAFCHGPDRAGPGDSEVQFYPPVPSLARPQNQLTDSQMHFVIQRGIRYTAMPSFAKALSDDQIWKVVLWIRSDTNPGIQSDPPHPTNQIPQ
jgi:mono/diheme cytochrome c family protein